MFYPTFFFKLVEVEVKCIYWTDVNLCLCCYCKISDVKRSDVSGRKKSGFGFWTSFRVLFGSSTVFLFRVQLGLGRNCRVSGLILWSKMLFFGVKMQIFSNRWGSEKFFPNFYPKNTFCRPQNQNWPKYKWLLKIFFPQKMQKSGHFCKSKTHRFSGRFASFSGSGWVFGYPTRH